LSGTYSDSWVTFRVKLSNLLSKSSVEQFGEKYLFEKFFPFWTLSETFSDFGKHFLFAKLSNMLLTRSYQHFDEKQFFSRKKSSLTFGL